VKRLIFNQKGGVGKSSITCNLAAIAANDGLRTLVVDLDAQGDSSHYLLGAGFEEALPDVADYFKQCLNARLSKNEPMDFVHSTPYDNLFVLPASPELSDLQSKLESKHKIYKLRDLLTQLEDQFDLIFIDTAPAFNFFTLSALIAVDTCLIPFDCDSFARNSLYMLRDVIDEIRDDHNDLLKVEGIIVNQFQARANLPNQIVEQIIADGQPVFPVYLSSSVKMRESHESFRPLIDLAPTHPLTQQFGDLYKLLKS